MSEMITSMQNKIVKEVRRLADKKFRNATGLFLLEGINLIKDLPYYIEVEYYICTQSRAQELDTLIRQRLNGAVKNEGGAEDAVFCGCGTERAEDVSCGKKGAEDSSLGGENLLDTRISRTRAQVYCVSDEVMQSISDTVTPYGIAAVCRQNDTAFALPKGNALLLDGVSDPGNVGTIFRTAAACGFEDIYLLDCADVYAPKVVRATLGSLFKVRFYRIDGEQALMLVRQTNSAVLDMNGTDILSAPPKSPLLFIAGSEAHGVSDMLKGEAKRTYSLPMKNDIESLNVAVATSVAMYQTL